MKEIEKKSLEARALEALREAIIGGAYPAGARLTEIHLAERLGLSRGTIRTALHQLAAENLVVQIPYTGWHVVSLSERDIWELSTLRSQLDGLAAEIYASLPAMDHHPLEEALARLLSACERKDAKAARKADWSLHKIIAEKSGHRRLLAQYQLIEHQWLLYTQLQSAHPLDFEGFSQEHRQLADALSKGRPRQAAQIAEQHNLPRDKQFYRQVAQKDNPTCVWPGLKAMEEQMLNHISIGVRNLETSKKFYETILQPLGMSCSKSNEKECYFGTDSSPVIFVLYPAENEPVVGARSHVALNAPTPEAVDDFDRRALKAGGTRIHAAGRRPDLGDPTYYGAMVKDLDGHVIEVLTGW